MKESKIKGQHNIDDIEKIINKLRLKLTRTYETNGHTDEVVKISQELDKYIVLVQQELLKLENAKIKEHPKR
ncbi:aspartyl-phosphate phosphatase Spo0E family protein [Alkaliphilus sp. MSJ-5]|uniref:Aspartyl-phosphate phosphatase Spo0E family protein n=1 Tax=Alkaliphilus flagellatus TaxID=2841507 RepID=A0ABS6G408_9FIRM|nr:aspartyl-phosphate phosphatase Spo0E family protein [Alkaliphilus flagellatus]MBU5677226.1 aspartyl-phosphate phosphatase Spo0E family protein [Alkaliphilus flagellatus]